MSLTFTEPPFSNLKAQGLAAFFAISYVAFIYVSKDARIKFSSKATANTNGQQREKQQGERWRNDPGVIAARMWAVGYSTLTSCLVVFITLVPEYDNELFSAKAAYVRLGFALPTAHLPQLLLSCLVAPMLFLGPLYVCFLEGTLPLQRRWSFKYSVLPRVATWEGARNYIVGPITEEIVYRACLLSVYHLAGSSKNKMIYLSPLWFGLAHLHHAWDIYNRFGRNWQAAQRAILTILVQLGYTSLFGFHCAFQFLRSGSLIPPIVSHIFCNIMGLPGFAEDVSRFPGRRYSIMFAYVAGIVGYVYALRNWTLVPGTIYWPDESGVTRY